MAIVGYGYIADYHARAIRGNIGTRLHGVLGRNAEACTAFATRYGAQRTYTDPNTLAQDPEVDALLIAWPNALHAPIAEMMMAAGKHVLVEKPMAINGAQARSMERAATRHGVQLMVGHMWRFDREAQALRALIKKGHLGDIVKTKGYGIHTEWGPSGWFTDAKLAGGGALIDMGVHAIDTVRYLLGDPEPESVFARLSTRHGDYSVDDEGVLIITWKNATVSIIESGWWQTHSDGAEASTQLFGTKGYARLFPTSWWYGKGEDKVSETPCFPPREEHCDQHIYDGQISAFVEAIRGRKALKPGPVEGRIVMDICDAAYQSSESGQVVRL